MPNCNAGRLWFYRDLTAAEQLERLSRSPLRPHRAELRALAGRVRTLETVALAHGSDRQLTLMEVA